MGSGPASGSVLTARSLDPASDSVSPSLSAPPLTSAQVLISQFMGSSPASGSVLTDQSMEHALDSVSPSLSAPPRPSLSLKSKQIFK